MNFSFRICYFLTLQLFLPLFGFPSLQRYEQEQEPAALATGVYIDVND